MAEESGVVYDSVVRVTWDPGGENRILVQIGDPMWQPVMIDGEQVVDTAQGLNKAGVENFPRGNESHVLTFTLARVTPGIKDAFQERLARALAAPRNKKDVLLSFGSGTNYRLKNAAVKSWPNDQVGQMTKETLQILGGEIIEDGSEQPDPIGLQDSALNLSRHDTILKTGGTPALYKDGIALWENTGTGDDAVQPTAGSQPRLMVGPALYLPGVSGNRFSSAANTAETQFYVRWAGILPTYTPAARVCLLSKWKESTDERGWALFLETTGQVTLSVSVDGTAGGITNYTSSLPIGMQPNTFVALQVTRGSVEIVFEIFPDLTWSFNSAIRFAPAITGAPLVQPARYSPIHLVVGATDDGSANYGEMRVNQIRYAPNVNAPGHIEMDFSGGQGEWAGVSSVTRAFAGTDPMIEMSSGNFCGRFDGINDSLILPTPVKLNAVSGCSIFLFGQIHRTTGTNGLVFMGSNDADPRILLRMDGGTLKLIVRRLDAEATAEVSTAVGVGAYYISASIDFVAGTGTIYTNRTPRAVGALTSAGLTSATDSSETRIGAGQGGANPANLDVQACHIVEKATNPIEHDAIWKEIIGVSGF